MPDAQRAEIAKLEALHAEHPQGRIFTHLAEAYRKAGELDRARDVLAEGIGRHPDYSSAHVVLARVLADLGQRDEAIDEFRRVLELDSHNLVALRALGDLSREAGRSEQALGYYHRLLDVEPSDDDVREAIEALEGPAPLPLVEPEPDVGIELETLFGEPAEEEASSPPDADEGAPWVTGGAADEEEPFTLMGWEGAEEEGEGEDEQGDEQGDDTTLPPPDTGEPGVMTETIAQVYARQGLYDRAAEVYRGLVRARPDDAGLRTRVEEMEALADQAASDQEPEPLPGLVTNEPEEPVMDVPPPPDEEDPWAASPASEPEQEPEAAESEPEPEPWRQGAEAAEEEPWTAAPSGEGPGEEAEDEQVESVWTGAEGAAAGSESPYAWAEGSGDSGDGGGADESAPIAGYFQGLLGWSGGAEAGPAASPEQEAEAGGPAESGGESGGEPGGEPGGEGPDDEDLDTFRSWLESLKQ